MAGFWIVTVRGPDARMKRKILNISQKFVFACTTQRLVNKSARRKKVRFQHNFETCSFIKQTNFVNSGSKNVQHISKFHICWISIEKSRLQGVKFPWENTIQAKVQHLNDSTVSWTVLLKRTFFCLCSKIVQTKVFFRTNLLFPSFAIFSCLPLSSQQQPKSFKNWVFENFFFLFLNVGSP